ncbi:MAG: hypothetical protein Q8R00_03475 [Candidatus Nanoarchaeia archaeon]|nr:hypothetical protein [Candidatus Nanoarchaeia archaeon]
MTETELETDYFNEAIASQSKRLIYDEKGTRAILEKKLSQPLLPYERTQVNEFATKYACTWFVKELAKKYKIISNDIYRLKRGIIHNEETITVPSIWNINVRKMQDSIKTMDFEVEDKYRGRKNIYKVSAEIPEFTDEAKNAYIEALTLSSKLYTRALKDPLLSSILLSDVDEKIPLPHKDVNYFMIWSPDKLETILHQQILPKPLPKPVDPALILEYGGKDKAIGATSFIVHKWESANELSIDALLKEFSISKPSDLESVVDEEKFEDEVPF